jgi:hypothetical protein
MTLRHSRRSFRKVVWNSSSATWARLHEEAFRYFGGVVQYVVLDNLKEGVIKPDIFEPELNRVYAEMLKHYGVVADAARVRDPNRKGTVESAIQHTQATALKGRRFDSIEAQNEFLDHWETNWAAKRIHGRAKRQVEDMFQEERAHLKPLPVESFRYFTEYVRTVQDDTTVQVDSAWYAARPAGIGSQVLVRGFDHDAIRALPRGRSNCLTPSGCSIRHVRPRPCSPEPAKSARTPQRSASVCSTAKVVKHIAACGASSDWPSAIRPGFWSTRVPKRPLRRCPPTK